MENKSIHETQRHKWINADISAQNYRDTHWNWNA
jgi:hypothetical protein